MTNIVEKFIKGAYKLLNKVETIITAVLSAISFAGLSVAGIFIAKQIYHNKQNKKVNDKSAYNLNQDSSNKDKTQNLNKPDTNVPRVKFKNTYLKPTKMNQIRSLVNESKEVFEQKSIKDIKSMWVKRIFDKGLPEILGFNLQKDEEAYLIRLFCRELRRFGDDINKVRQESTNIMHKMSKNYTNILLKLYPEALKSI